MEIKLTNVFFFPIVVGIRKKLIKLIMRTFIFLFCVTLFGLTPKYTLSQNERIVIDADKKLSVDEVFKMIKSQTDYSFVYHEDLFKKLPKVRLKKGVFRLNKLLEQSLSASDINVIFTINNTILIKKIININSAQQHVVTGIVADESGLPMLGVTVLIKGTNKGVPTDIDGNYTITVSDPASVLVFSYQGLERKEIIVGNQSIINVTLKESLTELDVVEITGRYYNNSQREETGSVSKIDAKVIEKQPVNNPLAAMQGHIPGLNITQNSGVPGGNYRIRIRGQNFIDIGKGGTFGTTNDPLYVIDGIPYDSASLEDKSNIAGLVIPGGVSPLNSINPADIKSIEVLKDADATAIYGSRGANGVVLITTKKGKVGKTQVKLNVSTTLSEVTDFVELLATEKYLEVRKEALVNDGSWPVAPEQEFRYPDLFFWDQNRYTDWQEVLIGDTAYRQNAQLSFSGGNEHTQFMLSGNYVNESTVFLGDFKYNKTTVRLNVNHQSEDKRFNLNTSVNYGVDVNNLPGTDLTDMARLLAPNAPALYDNQGNLNWENSTWENPLAVLETKYKARSHSLITNAVLSYRPIQSLEVKTSLGYIDYRLESHLAQPHTSLNPNGFINYDSSLSSIRTNDGVRQSWVVEPQINWKQYWGNTSLKLLVGATFSQNKNQQLGNFAKGFPSNDLLLDLSAATFSFVSQDSASEYKYQSFYSRININWQDKYILNLTGRRDGSSRFGPRKQFGYFGAVGGAWLFSEENFLKNSEVLSFGKLRTSYGVTGSDTSPDYSFYDSYIVSGLFYNGSSLAPTRLFNPNFAWEETKKLEVALELGFLKDHIFLSTAWYRNRSSNQLLASPLPATTGFGVVNTNLDAIVENIGFEIDLRTVNMQRDHFKWSTTFNISANKNKLVAFPGLEGSTYANQLVIGKPLGISKLYHFIGLDSESGIYQFEDYNNDGDINTNDANWTEDLTPKYFGGLGNTIAYKNLQLDVFFQFTKQKGRKYIGGLLPPGQFISNMPVQILDRWQQVGDENSIQRYSISDNEVLTAWEKYGASNSVVTDASFIRLRNVSLSYTVPKTKLNGLDINIYLQGQNLFVITPYDGADPEVQTIRLLPPLRQFTIGLNLGF